MNEITAYANAKINLGLRVKFKRDDGFHEIESIFQEINFADKLILKKSNEISFDTNSPELKQSETNLCIQAAELLQQSYNIDGLNIFLDKQIPIGSGLGGGSSDAAEILKSANTLYNKNVKKKDLKKMAEQIGSDVPFFIEGKTSHVSGRGEIIDPFKINCNYYVLLVFPKVRISTAEAYKSLGIRLTKNNYDYKFKSSNLLDLSVRDFKIFFSNDFEKVIFNKYPNLLKIKDLLYHEQAEFSSLSGSGATIYGIYSSIDKVKNAFSKISESYNCFIAKPIY